MKEYKVTFKTIESGFKTQREAEDYANRFNENDEFIYEIEAYEVEE